MTKIINSHILLDCCKTLKSVLKPIPQRSKNSISSIAKPITNHAMLLSALLSLMVPTGVPLEVWSQPCSTAA
jgi:hypothetical protein